MIGLAPRPNGRTPEGGFEYRRPWAVILGALIGAGIAGVVIYALHTSWTGTSSALAVGLLLSGASLVIGGLTGFLFGIPRSLQGQPPPGVPPPPASTAPSGGTPATSSPPLPPAPAAAPPSPAVHEGYGANTNLEQISDWLTKILVGVGLTQIASIRAGLVDASSYMGAAIGGPAGPQAALTIMLYFSVCGFLYGFLWSRLFLIREFAQADLEARQQRVEAGERQAQIDARALSLTNSYLGEDVAAAATVSVDELKAAIKRASPSVKTTVFYQAWKVRSENWRNPSTKPRMERTIPVFEALVEDDVREIYHTGRGQLAFALKDKIHPTDDDLRRAVELLTKAIEIRQRRQEDGWLFYEFNRAVCRIQLDAEFRAGRRSAPKDRELILADLEAAGRAEDILPLMETEPPIRAWMEINHVTRETVAGQGRST